MTPIWSSRKVVVCVGTGGVGKTTVSAALAIAAASAGKKTLAMTIDPARRLANALGVADIGNVEREIPAENLRPYGVQLRAPLFAMVPDAKRIFDDLVERASPDQAACQRILHSRLYQHFSSALVGSHEYAAVQKLHELYAAGAYDLIVLDTPPSQNAVDFLDAPGRMLDFLDSETMQWLLKPYMLSGKFSLKVLDLGSSLLLGTLGKLAGGETLREIADFLISFRGMVDGFTRRSREVKKLLTSEELVFALVTGPRASQHRAMLKFRDELLAQDMRIGCIVVNRLVPALSWQQSYDAFSRYIENTLGDAEPLAIAPLIAACDQQRALAKTDQENIAQLCRVTAGTPVWSLPELSTDIHDLEGLTRLQHSLMVAGDTLRPDSH